MKILYVLLPILVIGVVCGYTLPGHVVQGDIDMYGNLVYNSTTPVNGTDLSTKSYVDTAVACMDFVTKSDHQLAYDVIVYKDGSDVIAKYRNGTTVASGTSFTDDSSVIMSAINALTADRVRKELLVVIGDYHAESVITIPSYTIVDFSLATVERYFDDGPLINTSDYAQFVDIIGGRFDARGSVTSGTIGIELMYASNCTVQGCYVENTDLMGIIANYGGSFNQITRCTVYNSGNDGIDLNSNSFSYIDHCTVIYPEGTTEATCTAYDLYDACEGCSVVECVAYNPGGTGVSVESYDHQVLHCTVSLNHIHAPHTAGIIIATTGSADPPRYIEVSYNTIRTAGDQGILDSGGWYNDFSHNQLYTCVGNGIELASTTLDTVTFNTVVQCGLTGINETGTTDYSLVLGNTAWGNTVSGAHIIGAGSLVSGTVWNRLSN